MERNISTEELRAIKRALPDFKKLIEYDDDIRANGLYKLVFVSVFDHWLLPDEAEAIHVDDNLKELYARRVKFKRFIEEVFRSTTLYTYRYKRHDRLHVQKLTTLQSVLHRCRFDRLWSESGRGYSFLLPVYGAIYQEEFDWTNMIWYQDEEQVQPLLAAAEGAGLHLLY